MNVKNSCRRALSLVLVLCMLVGIVPMGVISAAAATEEPIYVLAGGDFQAGDNGKEDHYYSRINMGNILDKIKVLYSGVDMDGFLFVGDYDGDTHNDSNANAGVAAMMEEVSERYSNLNHDNSVLIEGNHETGAVSGIDPTGGYEFDGYAVYAINETDYCERQSGKSAQIQTVADNLETWLNNKLGEGYDAPIFVITHVPLAYGTRTYTNGDGLYAKYIFDVLNTAADNGLNIIFLHGHDHAYGADNYLGGEAIYLPKGDKINIAEPGNNASWTEETLNFTYMNAGYVGYYNENYYNVNSYEAEKLTMTVFKIENNQVTVQRISKDGLYNLKSAGREGFYANSKTCADIGLSYNTTVYSSPQTIALTAPGGQITLTDSATDVSVTGLETEGTFDDNSDITVSTVSNVAALNDTEKYLGYKAYDLTFTVTGSAKVAIPVPENYPLANIKVYYVDGTTLTDMNAVVSGSGSNRYATFVTTHNSTYAVVNVNNSGSLKGWTDVSSSGSGYTYTLDTDGIDYGEEHNYIIVDDNEAIVLNANSASNGTAHSITISGNTATLNTRDYEYHMIRTSYNGTRYELITKGNGSQYLYQESNGVRYGTRSSVKFQVNHHSNGIYDIHDIDGTNWYIIYNGSWTVTETTSARVRLYKYTGEVAGETGFAKLTGDTLYTVSTSTNATAALNAVKAGITGYLADDENGTNQSTISDSDLTWTWVDTYKAEAGSYTVAISYNGVELGTVEVQVIPEATTGDWVTITEPTEGTPEVPGKDPVYGYTYTLDTDGVDTGVNYIIVASGATKAMGNGTLTATDVYEISGNTASMTSRDYEWYFTSDGKITNGTQWLSLSVSGGGYFNSPTATFNVDNSEADANVWEISNSGGNYTISFDYTYSSWGSNRTVTYYLRYNSNSFDVATSSNTVRLYSYTGETVLEEGTEGTPAVPGKPGLYAMADGSNVEVMMGTTAANALAAVKEKLTVYTSESENGANATETTDYQLNWVDTYNSSAEGSYTVEVIYGGESLGTVEVIVKPKVISSYSLSADVGYVAQYAAANTIVTDAEGNPIKVYTNYADGTSSYVNLTVAMIQNSETGVAGQKTPLTVEYNGYTVSNTFTLNVVERVLSDYPEYPDQGAVKVNKTATGHSFQDTGVSEIELSASGVPVKKGADVIVMLDTSSSMTSHNVTGSSNTRAQVLEESLKELIKRFKTPSSDGELMDIRVAIADFNGFYGENHTQSGTAYDRDAADMMSDDISYNANSEAKIYTGDGKLGAGAFVNAIDLDDSYTLNYTSGTNYDYAMDAIYQMGSAIKATYAEGEPRDLYVIFMSDGAAMQWNYYHSQGASSLWNNWITGAWDADDLTAANLNCTTHKHYYNLTDTDGDGMLNEHWMANAIKGDADKEYKVIRKTAGLGTAVSGEANMYMVPGLGATMFSISFDAQADTNVTEESMDKSIETLASDQTGTTQYYYKVTSAAELTNAFSAIGAEIAYAATNARFVDVMGESFNLQMGHTINTIDNEGNDITIDLVNDYNVTPSIIVKTYEIYTRQDYINGTCTETMIGQRKSSVPTILEKVIFNAAGTAAYSSANGWNAATGEVTNTVNIIKDGVICGSTFWYNTNKSSVYVDVDGDGAADDMLDTDGDGLRDDLLPAETFYWKVGTVQTKELAISYFVYLAGSLEGDAAAGSYATNQSAVLYYDNYLGNPCYKETTSPMMAWESASVKYAFYLVNEDGKVIVNQTTGETGTFANRIAVTQPILHSEILLNNLEAINSIDVASIEVLPEGYTIYDTASKYTIVINSGSSGGSWSIVKGDDKAASTYVTGYSGSAYSNDLSSIGQAVDYTNTTVWFAVVWQIQTLPDTVVIDFGLPVDINVLGNDMFGDYGKLNSVAENGAKGDVAFTGHTSALKNGFGATVDGTYGTLKLTDDGTELRYTLNKANGMQMAAVEEFDYAIYYSGPSNAGYYYGDVTVVPASIVYYEESFVTFADSTATSTLNSNYGKWDIDGTVDTDAVQDEDRAGFKNLPTVDANNVYGYDSSYATYTQFSNGGANKVTVDQPTGHADTAPTATFTFTGTGFDVISLTNNDAGCILVTVKDSAGNVAAVETVNNYYGYKYGPLYDEDGNAIVDNDGNAVEGFYVDKESADTLWQIPVLKVDSLTYGTYTVEIKVVYIDIFDHNKTEESYSFWLDAIRIYDPAPTNGVIRDDDPNTTDNEAVYIGTVYEYDNEANADYVTIKDIVLDSDVLKSATSINGIVFIDGKDATSVPADYANPGPNNETYLTKGQGIAFKLVSSVDPVANGISVQYGAKLVYGTEATLSYNDGIKTRTFNTASDMYYPLSLNWVKVVTTTDGTTTVHYEAKVLLSNATAGAVISLTNLKVIGATLDFANAGTDYVQPAAKSNTVANETVLPEVSVVSDVAYAEEAAITLLKQYSAEELYEIGDINGDGIVNGKDSNLMTRIVSGNMQPTLVEKIAADIKEDNTLNGVDANSLKRIVAGN